MNDWRQAAACRGWPTEMFFPLRGEPVEGIVRELCEGCPVIGECLDWALHHELNGYWGGTPPKLRRKMRQRAGIRLEQLNGGDTTHRFRAKVSI